MQGTNSALGIFDYQLARRSPTIDDMNADVGHPKRLHWWFWLLLFAPAMLIVMVAPLPGVITLHPGERNWLSNLVWPGLLVLNFVNSLLVAAVLERSRTGRRSMWSLGVGALLFFLNLFVSFGGCAVLIFLD